MFKLDGREMKRFASLYDAEKVRKFLNGLKFGELISSQQLIEKFGYDQISGSTRFWLAKKLKNNCYKYQGKWVWGSEKTIKEFKKQIEHIF